MGAAQVSWRLRKTVVLVGMMGAGKTAVGTQLARSLGCAFTDSDDEIMRAANMTIPEIFARDGEAFFRAREAEVLARLLRGPTQVLSTGGGAFLSPANRAAIAERAVSVWLRAEVEVLWSRVRHRSHRPLLRTADPRGTLAALAQARAPVYALADVTVDSLPGLSIDAMAQRVIAALAARGDVVEPVGG
ncbi:MAG: shikimate kinase [Gemmobacter sp.]